MSVPHRLVEGLPEDDHVAAAIVAGLCAYLDAQARPAERAAGRGRWTSAARLESHGAAVTPAALHAVRRWSR